MLELIGQAMGKPQGRGQDIFWDALNAAGLLETVEEFEEIGDDYDDVGEAVYYGEGTVAAA